MLMSPASSTDDTLALGLSPSAAGSALSSRAPVLIIFVTGRLVGARQCVCARAIEYVDKKMCTGIY